MGEKKASSRTVIIGCGALTDLILSLRPLPICVPFLPPCFFRAHSHSLMVPSIYLSSSVSMGAASQRSLEVGGKKEAKPGVQQGHDGPWGWAERWGTDTGVCDKRMSFTANDSHRGHQMLSLQRLYTCSATVRDQLIGVVERAHETHKLSKTLTWGNTGMHTRWHRRSHSHVWTLPRLPCAHTHESLSKKSSPRSSSASAPPPSF